MSPKHISLGLMFLIASAIAACSSNPMQIATFPKTTAIAQYPYNPTVIYRVYMELKVLDVDQATARATSLAFDYRGYLVSSRSWRKDGRKVMALEFAVPTANFESLHRDLSRLGDLVSETTSSEPDGSRYYDSPHYSYIAVQLFPEGLASPTTQSTGWNPLRTIERAFSVFLTIFGFLADIVIWLTVVAGPFVLIILVILTLIRRLRKRGV